MGASTLVKACILPVAFYANEAQWDPESPEDKIHTLESATLATAKAVVPLWKTTPVFIVHMEAGVPPAAVVLAQRKVSYLYKLRGLPNSHPFNPACRRKCANRGRGGTGNSCRGPVSGYSP